MNPLDANVIAVDSWTRVWLRAALRPDLGSQA